MKDTKKLIIEKSLNLFIQRGFNGVTLRDIINEIGLSRGIFYYYFASKEECFGECVKYHLERTQAPELEESPLSLDGYLQAMITKMAVSYKDFEFLDRLSFLNEARKTIPDFHNYLKDRQERELSVWKRVIANAMQEGEIKKALPEEDIARLFIDQCDGAVVKHSLAGTYEDVTQEVIKGWKSLYTLLKQ